MFVYAPDVCLKQPRVFDEPIPERQGDQRMRPVRLATPFVVAPPCGARIRTRLRPTPADEQVLWAVGRHLGRLAGWDLAARCRGETDRAGRKRALTVSSSSRWAGAVTRTSNDQWERAFKNL